MICTTKTPLRVSLFGGGTDYPAYFQRTPGAVIGFAIDKYIYISALKLGGYVDYKYRLSYSKLEQADTIDAIEHPVVRTLLQHYGWDESTDFSIMADMPASAGLGSSSAFTVGFVNLMSNLLAIPRNRMELAREAIFTEQVLLKENVGVQDQLHATFGGINRFDFSGDNYRITPINISGAALKTLTDCMVLVFTGIKRRATQIVAQQVENTTAGKIDGQLGDLLKLVDQAQAVLESRDDTEKLPHRIAEMLHESWLIKKKLAASVTLNEIDELYEFCLANGALGGKLCGAGGGGFLLMVVPPEKRARFEEAVGPRRCVRFQIDPHGTQFFGQNAFPDRR
jgi:D-glycero-alpha-D-manno-heptose-7-phosphate kinase